MSTPAELRAQIAQTETEISALQRKYGDLKDALALEVCAFKPGDIIEWGRKVKFRGRVLKGFNPDYKGECAYRVTRILKDGSDGLPVAVDTWNHPTKVKE